MLVSITAYLPNVKETVMDITPVEVIKIPEEKEVAEEHRVKKEKEEPKPLPEEKVEKVEEIKTEPPPVEKKEEAKIQEAKIETPPVEKEEAQEVEPPPPIEEKVAKTGPPPPPLKEEKKVGVKSEPPAPAVQNSSPPSVTQGTTDYEDTETTTSTTSVTAQAFVPAPVSPPAPKPQDETASKYGVEGGTGRSTGDELTLFKTMVRAKIERAKFYPRWARERGFEGLVGVRFVILPDGKVGDLKVVRPCHCEILNKAACEAIKKASPFDPRPKELKGKEMAMEIDISYRLE